MVRGPTAHAEALKEGIAAVLSTMGLHLSPQQTLITHIDGGLDLEGRGGGQTKAQDATSNNRT